MKARLEGLLATIDKSVLMGHAEGPQSHYEPALLSEPVLDLF